MCIRCGNTGRYLGNGMMMTDCELCAEKEEKETQEATPVKIDRKSKSYKDAIKDIMLSSPGLTRVEAVKLFEDILAKS